MPRNRDGARRSGKLGGRLLIVAIVLVAIVAGSFVVKRLLPTRTLLAGDSLMALAGPSAVSKLDANGFRAELKAVPGTGLIDVGFDWVGALRGPARGKSSVVLEFVGNYFGVHYEGVPLGSPKYYELWSLRTQYLIEQMNGEGADVYLVLVPHMRDPNSDAISQQLNKIYVNLARQHPGHVGCIDGRTPLAGPGGGYAESLPGKGGVPEQVRTSDGVHLTDPGKKILGEAIARELIKYKGHHPPICTG